MSASVAIFGSKTQIKSPRYLFALTEESTFLNIWLTLIKNLFKAVTPNNPIWTNSLCTFDAEGRGMVVTASAKVQHSQQLQAELYTLQNDVHVRVQVPVGYRHMQPMVSRQHASHNNNEYCKVTYLSRLS